MQVKRNVWIFIPLLVLVAFVLSACGPAQAGATGDASVSGGKVLADGIAFTGTVEAINGNQWTIDGQVVTVDEHTALEANISVGDTVKVEATVGQDGSVSANKIEIYSGDDSIDTPEPIETESPDQIETPEPASTETPDPSSSETPDPNSSETPSSDQDNETTGAVEGINGDVWTIGGQDYLVTNTSEIKGLIQVGDNVKLEYFVNPDGSLTIKEMEITNEAGSVSVGKDDGSGSNPGSSIGDDHNSTSSPDDSHDGSTSSGSDDSNQSGSGEDGGD